MFVKTRQIRTSVEAGNREAVILGNLILSFGPVSVLRKLLLAFWHSLIFYHGHVEQRHGRIGPLGSIFQLFFKL